MHIYFQSFLWNEGVRLDSWHVMAAWILSWSPESILLPDEPFKLRSLKWAGNTCKRNWSRAMRDCSTAEEGVMGREKSRNTHTHTQALVISEGRGPSHMPSGTSQTQTSWIKPNVRIHRSPNNIEQICPPATFSRVIKGDCGFSVHGSWRASAHVTSTRRLVSAWWIVDFGGRRWWHWQQDDGIVYISLVASPLPQINHFSGERSGRFHTGGSGHSCNQ